MTVREARPPRRRSLARSAAATLIANPTSTAGGLVMTAMAIAIMTNALALQPGKHPAPLFMGTRPVAGAGAEATGEPVREPINLRDRAMVADIQLALKARGYYGGDVDGLPGPMTSAAIAAFEKASGLPATGTPSESLLAVLRRGAPARTPTPVPAPADDEDATLPAAPAAAGGIPLPVPSPRRVPPPDVRAAADEVDPVVTATVPVPPRPPAAEEATAAAAVPVPVETIRVAPDAVPAPSPAVDRAAPPPAPAAAPDPRLARVQEALDLLGYGPLRSDGVMTGDTRSAIRRFEESRGLPVTGEINERFIKELIRIGGLSSR